jgi:hypothetical protein
MVIKAVRQTLHKDDISEEEFNATWYSVLELPAGANDILACSFRARGLQPYSCSRCTSQSIRQRQKAWRVVIKESADQLQSGVESDELLAELYQEVNNKCLMDARRRGMKDEYSACFEAEIMGDRDEQEESCCCRPASRQRRSFVQSEGSDEYFSLGTSVTPIDDDEVEI